MISSKMVEFAICDLCAAVLIGVALAGCADLRTDVNGEVVDSLRYDSVPCRQLVARRDALVRTYGSPKNLPENEKPGVRPYLRTEPMGIFPLPDLRSAETRQRQRELGRIAGMDDSIERRQCQATPGKKKTPGA